MSGVARPPRASGTEPFRTLYQLLAALSRASTLDDVYDVALTSLFAATDADRAAILLFDDDGVMRFKASRGLSRTYQTAVTGHSPWKRGTRDAEPKVVSDVRLDPSLATYRELFQEEGIRAVALLPLALDAGVFGKFMLYYDAPHECKDEELEIAIAIAAHVALATEHKRAEIALAQSEQRLQAILDNSSTVIFLKDDHGRYLLVNRRYEELFHVTETDILGRTDYDLFPADMANRYQANDRAALAAGLPISIEEYVPHDDGIHTYVSVKFPLLGPDGGVTGVCGIATDITEQKRLEADRLHLAAIVESSEDAVISYDLTGTVESWNNGAARLFGYTAPEAIGKPVSILRAPDAPDEVPQLLSKIKQGLSVEHYETRRRKKNGQVIDVALTVSPVRDSAGRIVGASKIARDISDRKRAEQEHAILLLREQDARRTAELLNKVAPRLWAELDLEKLVQEVTDVATTLVGAEFGSFFHKGADEKAEQHTLSSLSGAPRDACSGSPLPLNAGLFALTFSGEAMVRCDDLTTDSRYGENSSHHGTPAGHPPVRSYLAAPVKARSGEVLGGLFFGHSEAGKFNQNHEAILAGIVAQAAIAMDNARLFERAQFVQGELKRSNEELRRANQDLEVFAYSASHDLQEPLRTISISTQIIGRNLGPRLQGEDATILGNILAASDRMSTLIMDLLTYTRATKYEEGPAPHVDSGRVLDKVLENMWGTLDETGAAVTAAELPVLTNHEARLAQLFQNLISNAIKYRSKEAPRVHVDAEERDGWCVFSVVDNGIGIESQYAERIFGLFKRLHGRDQYPGSGIGLAICQRVVEQYGGRIWLERSELGSGSTFCFALPSGTR